MTDVEQWISDAVRLLDLGVHRIPVADARSIVAAARNAFVLGNPRSWWLALAKPFQVVSSKGKNIAEIIPESVSRVFLVPETEAEELPVYELEIGNVDSLLGECPFFEYYVFPSDLSWLVIESDHDQYYICTNQVGENLGPDA